jgi:hypothetical protein
MCDVRGVERRVVIAVVVQIKRSRGMRGPRRLEPIDLRRCAEKVHQIVVRVGLVQHVPFGDQIARGSDDIRDVRERARRNLALLRRIAQRANCIRQIAPPGPHEHMTTHVQAVILQPGESGESLRFRVTSAPLSVPRRPFEIVFRAGRVEQLESFLPIDAVIHAIADDPSHLERRPKLKRGFLLLHANSGARHRPAFRIDHGDREIAFA